MNSKYIIVYIFLFTILNQVWVQKDKIRFEKITTDQGLSQPVVVLTSSDEERNIVESYRLGVNSYIVKPLDSEIFSNQLMK
jgi:AmiR/NasT family two-component response regulator